MPTTAAPRRRSVTLTAGALALALLAAGCGKGGSKNESGGGGTTLPPGVTTKNLGAEGTPKDGGKMVIAVEAETEGGFNPATGRFANSGHMVASSIYDPLATLDDKGNATPYLAEKIEPNADFTTWTITVRDGVKFHDGTPLTGEAVTKDLEAISKSLVTSGAMRSVDTITTTGPLTTEVKMKKPWSTFPYVLTTQAGYVAAPSTMTDGETMNKTATTGPIGTGPFKFQAFTANQFFKATKNTNYWQPGKPHLDEIEFRPIPDSQARTDALLNGEVDMIHTFEAREIRRLREADVKMIEYSRGEESFVQLNTSKAPFDELSAREALAYATDVKAFLQQTGRDIGDPAQGPFAAGQLGYEADAGYPAFNLETAKTKVAEYKQKTGKDLEFVYSSPNNPDATASAQALQKMWEAAGIKVSLEAFDQTTQIIKGALGQYQAIEWRNFGQPDPDGEYVWWTSASVAPSGEVALNFARYGTPEIDAALDDARTTLDPAQRDADYKKVARLMNQGVPYVWLERNVWALAAAKRVNGFGAAANGSLQTIGAKTWMADLWVS